MASPADPSPQKHFLDVEDAEIVDGSRVIAEKVSGALRDADRFDMPHLKPPLSDVLSKVRGSEGSPKGAAEDAAKQNALSCTAAEIDRTTDAAHDLKPADRAERV